MGIKTKLFLVAALAFCAATHADLKGIATVAGISPGGAPGQIQYNNGGAFGGFTMGGDLSCTVPNCTVTGIGGEAVSLGGSFATSGAFGLTLTLTGTTGLTLPTSGTLATTSQIPTAVSSLTRAATDYSAVGLNLTSAAATLSPTNANVVLSPTGTGTDTLNPAAAGSINNMSIGQTTPLAGGFSAVTVAGAGFAVGTPAFQINNTVFGTTVATSLYMYQTTGGGGGLFTGGQGIFAWNATGQISNTPVFSLGLTATGHAVSINASSNFPVTIGTGTTTSPITLGNAANTTELASGTLQGPTGNLLSSATAATVSSGGGTSPTVTANGTESFEVVIGSGSPGSSLVLTFPAAAHGWACAGSDLTTPSSLRQTGAVSTTSVTMTNYALTTGVATAFTASDALELQCLAN